MKTCGNSRTGGEVGVRPGGRRAAGGIWAGMAGCLLVGVVLGTGCDRGSAPGGTGAGSGSGSGPGVEVIAGKESVGEGGRVWFTEVAVEAGLGFRHESGHQGAYLMPEINAGGVGILDFDGDGRMDVFCVNGGYADPSRTGAPGHRLYRNLGGWRFEDVTGRAGVGANDGYGMGVACADYDGDGWTDLYLLNLRGNRLYRNRGDGTFEDVTARAGVGGETWSSCAAFFDFDGDGDLDLFVVNYLHWSMAVEVACSSRGGEPDYCSPLSYRAMAGDRLYRNRGDGTFEDVTVAFGVDRADGYGLGVVTGDFDGDGWLDVFVANDATPNQLWMNRGGKGFVDEAGLRGCALNAVGVPRAGMGVAAVDFRGVGWLDLFVTHLVGEGSGWFVNTEGRFADRITVDGPMRGSLPHTGFGVAVRDFDHDGEWDLYAANGRVRLGARDWVAGDRYAEPNLLLRGTGPGRFEEVAPSGGTKPVLMGASRGMAVADLDDDGAEDLVVVNKDGPLHVLRNEVGGGGHWIGLDVREAGGRLVPNVGVWVTAGGRVWWRQVQPHESYASSHDPRLVFGLGKAEAVEEVRVRWLDGREERWVGLEAGRYHRLGRGAGRTAESGRVEGGGGVAGR